MPEKESSKAAPPPQKAVHNSKGEVTIHNVRKVGNRWSFVCTNAKGRPASLLAAPKYWKTDITPILKQYEHLMWGNECRINPKLAARASQDEYQSAQQWYAGHGKSLPRIVNYDRYTELVRRAIKRLRDSSVGFGAERDDFDQDTISELMNASAPAFDANGEDENKAKDSEAESNPAWDEATADERFSAGNPDGADEISSSSLPEELNTDLELNQTTSPRDYHVAPAETHIPRPDRAFASVLANSPTQRKAAQEPDPDAEKITPIQRLVRSRMGDYLEMYFLFEDGMPCKDIAPKFRKLYVPEVSGPRCWGQLVACKPGDVRRAVENIKRWSATLKNKGAVLALARVELEKINRAAAWSELARHLPVDKPRRTEPEIDPSKKRGREWGTVDHISVTADTDENFDYDKFWANYFHNRRSKKPDSVVIPKVQPMSGFERVVFLQALADRIGANITYWVDADGRVRCSDENAPDPRLRPKPHPSVPDLPRVWRTEPPPVPVPYQKPDDGPPEDAGDRKRGRLRQLDNGLIRLLDSGSLTNSEQRRLVQITDLLIDGRSIKDTAKKMKCSIRTVNGLISTLKRAAQAHNSGPKEECNYNNFNGLPTIVPDNLHTFRNGDTYS
jgi:hypothetical protein